MPDLCLKALNAPTAEARLDALRALPKTTNEPSRIYVNNHIHTIYSFSPYSPTMAVYKAREAGLVTAGIMDHDTVAGAREFAEAGRILGVATTQGVECRVSLIGTPFENRHVNNPDQVGNAYVAMHGIPERSLNYVDSYMASLRRKRETRNQRMTRALSDLLAPLDISLDYERDVRSLSQAEQGGSVTERHLCMAAARALLERFGLGKILLGALALIDITPPERIAEYLRDPDNAWISYDLLGLLKSTLVPRFYIPASDGCPTLNEFISVCREAGAIAAYAYLGDVADSVTGDKAAQTFEDAFLDKLLPRLKQAGFHAITYMPTRNTAAQLARVQRLCKQHGFFEISGEDINSPRQSFICPALDHPEFAHLRTATWALIGHETAAQDARLGMFSPNIMRSYPDLSQRIARYAAIGAAREES